MPINFDKIGRFDYAGIIKFATFGLAKQKDILSKVVYLSVLYVIVFLFCVLFFIGAVGGGLLLAPSGVLIYAVLSFIGALIALVIGIYLGLFAYYYTVSFAFSAIGKKVESFTPRLAFNLLLVGICTSIASFLSLYDLKILVLAVTGAIIGVIGLCGIIFSSGNILFLFGGIILVLVSLVIFVIYLIFAVRNGVRLSFARLVLIEKNPGVLNSVNKSWDITGGKAIILFIVIFILNIIAGIISQIVMIPMQIGFSPLQSPFVTPQAVLTVLSMLIPLMILTCILLAIASAITALIEVFGLVAAYNKMAK
jgi:hypothetical protein